MRVASSLPESVHKTLSSPARRMDEACSNVRVELDSKPEAIDGMERVRVRLQVEEAALKKEKDQLSRSRLEQVCFIWKKWLRHKCT